MFNASLDAYGSVKIPAGVQKVAANRASTQDNNNQAALKAVGMAENRYSTEAGKAALSVAVDKLNELVAPALQTVRFSMDEEAGNMLVRVVDTSTQKTIRQIPNEEVLAFSKTLGRLQGLVIRDRA